MKIFKHFKDLAWRRDVSDPASEFSSWQSASYQKPVIPEYLVRSERRIDPALPGQFTCWETHKEYYRIIDRISAGFPILLVLN